MGLETVSDRSMEDVAGAKSHVQCLTYKSRIHSGKFAIMCRRSSSIRRSCIFHGEHFYNINPRDYFLKIL